MKPAKLATSILVLFSILLIQGVSAQELTFYTGVFSETYFQDDQKITRTEFKEILKKDEAAWESWRRGQTNEILGGVTAFGSGLLLGLGIGRDRDGEDATAYYIGSAGAFVASLIFTEISQKKKRKAVLKYNSNLDRKTTFKLTPSRRGFGIAVHF